MAWLFEVFYRKRIAAMMLPLQTENESLKQELSSTRSLLSETRIEKKALIEQVAKLTADLERSTPRNGMVQSQYANIALPYPLVDRDGESLAGTYQGHTVDYELTCEGRGGLTVLRYSLMRYDKLAYLALEAVGSGFANITIRQTISVNGSTSIAIKELGSVEIKAGVEDYELSEINCTSLEMLLLQARMHSNNLAADS